MRGAARNYLALGLGAFALLLWWLELRGPAVALSPEQETAVLAASLGDTRVVEPRVSGGFRWGPWPASDRNNSASIRAQSLVLASAAEIQRWQAISEDPGWTRAMAVRRLFLGEVTAAVRTLEANRASEGQTPAWLNDLAAGYFIEARAGNDIDRLVLALDVAEQAVRGDPGFPEASFNRALILERIGPATLAVEAWSEYLAIDSSSEWAAEATARRDRLVRELGDAVKKADLERGWSREAVEEHYLAGWAQGVLEGHDVQAASFLNQARSVSAEVLTRYGDAYASNLVEDVERHARGSDVKALARVFVDILEARRLLVESNNVEGAGRLLVSVRRYLAKDDGALADLVQYWSLLVDWYRGPPEAIEAPLRQLIANAERHRNGFIEARARVFLGSVLHRLARYSDAIDSYQLGVKGLVRFGEREAEPPARMLLAGALREHGLWSEAWSNERLALEHFDALAGHAQRHNVIREAVRLALAQGRFEAAALYQRRLLNEARAWNDPGATAAAIVHGSRIELQRQNVPEAARLLDEAEQLLGLVADPSFRNSYRVELLSLRAEVMRTSAPEEAFSSARELVLATADTRTLHRRVRAFWLLGRAAEAAGHPTEAVAAWRQGIAVLGDDDTRLREEQLRIARTSDVWGIFADLIRLLVELERPVDALAVAEQGRARALAFSLSQRSLDRTATDLFAPDSGETVLYYETLPDRSLAWVIDRHGVALRRLPGGGAVVTELTDYLFATAERHVDPAPILAELYGRLIAPVADLLPRSGSLVVVPDGALSAVPFAALISPTTGRYLVEDLEVRVSPSLALLRRSAAGDPRKPERLNRVLAVGAGTVSLPGLFPLPGARLEAEAVAALYPDGRSLTHSSVSADTFLAAVGSSDVVHFAGHAVENRDFPGRSFLALPGGGSLSRVTADQVTAANFGRVGLLILSACSTAGGAVQAGEGVLSLTRPFLAAGIPAVLATVGPVDDRVGALMVQFHRGLRSGLSPAAALRAVQLEAIGRERAADLRGWAAFELFGGA